MGNDDNDGSDAPDWSLVEGFRTGGDSKARPKFICSTCGSVKRYDGACQEPMNYPNEFGTAIEEGPCGGRLVPFDPAVQD
jgi:hypothetical protein